jgi:hypothetical protein
MSAKAEARFERVSIRPGVSVLSVLRYLNYKPWFALAEFVDNAVQSYLSNRDALVAADGAPQRLRVSIEIDSIPPGRITIRDNAAGIAGPEFPRAFRPAVVPPDASGLSEFGMGMKSAACWFSSHWRVRTKAVGEMVERTVSFDIERIVNDDLEELEIHETPARHGAHYTEIVLEGLHHVPVGRTIGKIKEHLTDIYRMFVRDGTLDLRVGGEPLIYEPPNTLVAPYAREEGGKPRIWKKEISFDLGQGQTVKGFAALRDPGNHSRTGFALFRRGRLIQGSGDEGYRPQFIFLHHGSYRYLRLFGELELEGFEVSHTKDGFRWNDEDEQPFLELLREHLDSEDLPLLKQADAYRALATKRDRAAAATKALERTSKVIESSMPDVLPRVADAMPVETQEVPLAPQASLARRELNVKFRGSNWIIRIELSDDPAEGDWLTISDRQANDDGNETLEIRIAMTHPFMLHFAQTDPDDIEALIRVGAAIAISEKLARRAGVKMAGTIRRNVNEILREALSRA